MKKLAERITDSELEVMRVLWSAKKALNMTAILEALTERGDWEESTIRTFVRRLIKKGAVMQEKREVYYYSPLVTQEEYGDYSTRLLINKLYNGKSKNLIAALVSNESFTDEEIAELRAMLHLGERDD